MSSQSVADAVFEAGQGMASVRQLVQAGVDRRWVARQVASGDLRRVSPGVVRTAANPGRDSYGRMRAALLVAGPHARLSHQSAAVVWGMLGESESDVVHVSVPHGQRLPRRTGMVFHQTRRDRLAWRNGWPLTQALDTVLDMVADMDPRDARCLVATAVENGLVTIAELSGARGPRRGEVPIARMAARELRAGARSGPEMWFWRGVYNAQMPLPELNAPVLTRAGIRHPDGLWRPPRLGFEIDGRAFHSRVEDFERDPVRINAIQAEGIVLLRFTAARVFRDLDAVLRETEEALRMRCRELRVSWKALVEASTTDFEP